MWSFIAANKSEKIEAQHLKRIGAAPVISLKRDNDDRWVVWILDTNGTSVRAVYLSASLTLIEAKEQAEQSAIETGWEFG